VGVEAVAAARARESTVPVLVVGAGPVGLSLAVELARNGTACRIVDRLPAPSPHSGATELHARTLELLDHAGLAESLLGEGIVIEGMALHTPTRCLGVLGFEGIASEFPSTMALPQHETERLLAAALTARGGVVERGRTAVALEQDADAATVTVETNDGARERVRAQWVVACDGAHSTLRELLGIAFEGGEYPHLWAGMNARVDGWPYPLNQYQTFLDQTQQWSGPLPGGWLRTFFRDDDGGAQPTAEHLQRVLDQHVAAPVRVREIADAAYFKLHHRLASAFRAGRVLLAGDAAHTISPAGGLGMNAGIQDAHNLAWKLALVAAGAAAPTLLDSYDAERRGADLATVRKADIFQQGASADAAAARAWDRALAVQLASPLARLAMLSSEHELEIHYRESPLVAGHRVGAGGRSRRRPAWDGPTPGDRIYAPGLLVTADGATTSLRALQRGTAHQLLILAGEADAAALAAYVALAASAKARFGRWLDAAVVVVADRPPAVAAPGVAVLADPAFGVHGHLGAAADTLYLIRPDGYLGYGGEPPDGARLAAYFAAIVAA
jgi:2-polyprenyl-6-methoxyphenol hydroxylase-like FAD-dependent oxidoreductase